MLFSSEVDNLKRRGRNGNERTQLMRNSISNICSLSDDGGSADWRGTLWAMAMGIVECYIVSLLSRMSLTARVSSSLSLHMAVSKPVTN